jgi:hypothetical protein
LIAIVIALASLACDRRPTSSASASASVAPSLAATSVAAPPRPSAAEASFRVGERARAADYTLTLVSVGECNKVERYFRPRTGYLRLGVQMQFEATGEKLIPVNGFYARIVDSAGNTYSPTLGGCEPTLPTRRILKPETVSGWISYDVPEKAGGFTLSYNPFIVGSMKQELRFRLPR